MWLGIAQEFPIVSVQEVLAEQNVYGRQIPTNLPLQIQGMERFLLKHPALLKEYHRVRSFLLRQMGLHYYVANRGRVAQYGVLV